MEKVIRDGFVAVLVSPGFGAGWFSWHDKIELLFDPIVVKMVEEKRFSDIESYIDEKYNDNDDHVYCGGAYQLIIRWIPEGTPFRISEYDGSESLVEFNIGDYVIA